MRGALLYSLSLILFFAVCCGTEKAKETGGIPEKKYLNHHPDAKYVGREACKSCHADKYETFIHSEMGISWKPASISKSVANFHSANPVFDSYNNLWYYPFSRGENLFIREFRLDGKDTVYQREEKIDFIVGSGQHTNSHILEENGYLNQAPLTWYAQEGKWDLPPGFENGNNTRFSRMIEIECMTCHNAMPRYVGGSDNQFEMIRDGIDCERCHGPGSFHIKEKQEGSRKHLIDGIDYTIVHPGKLPEELQFDICQRCHLQGTAVLNDGKSFMDFRPGMKLNEVMNVFLPRFKDSVESFIMASHPDRLRMSECFIGSHGENYQGSKMTCVTCHNPHVSIKSRGPELYREACQRCHNPEKKNECKAPLVQRNAKNDLCNKCHMPPSGSTDIPHVKITDHFIRIPEQKASTQKIAAQKEFLRLACLTQTNPSPLVMAEGYLAYFEQFDANPRYLDSAESYLRRTGNFPNGSNLLRPVVRLFYLQENFREIQKLASGKSPAEIRDGWTLYRIGESLSQLGDSENGIAWMKQAVESAPMHLRFRNKLASTLIAAGKPAEAIPLLDKLIELNPKFESAHNNRGFAHVLLNNFPKAEIDFLEELKLDPDAEQALANLASIYLNTNRRQMAKPLLDRLLKINPGNQKYRQLLKMASI